MARKAAKAMETSKSPGWMTTYGDLMSLLLVFFIMLAAFSTIEITKFNGAMAAMQGGSGVLKPGTGPAVLENPETPESAEFDAALGQLAEELRQNNLSEMVRVFWDKTGVRIVLQNEVLFPAGSADLNPRYLGVLDQVIQVIRTLKVAELQVEGHTDDTPIGTARFPSNWELSTARALAVLHYIERQGVVQSRKLAAHGFSEYRPYVPNDSPENKAKNRRVEIYIRKQS